MNSLTNNAIRIALNINPGILEISIIGDSILFLAHFCFILYSFIVPNSGKGKLILCK